MEKVFVGLQAGAGPVIFAARIRAPRENYPTMDCAIFHETSNLMPLPHDCFTPPGGSHGQRPSLLHSPRRFLGNMWPSSSGPAASTMVSTPYAHLGMFFNLHRTRGFYGMEKWPACYHLNQISPTHDYAKRCEINYDSEDVPMLCDRRSPRVCDMESPQAKHAAHDSSPACMSGSPHPQAIWSLDESTHVTQDRCSW